MIHQRRSTVAAPGDTIAHTAARARPRRQPTGRRRGVLLLVVLSMLTLFLMLGAAYLVAATRARESARAYARLTLGSDDARVPHAQLLDSVLLRAIRGPAIPAGMVATAPISFESLLADKYGADSISGTATNITQTGPIIELTLASPKDVRPTDLCGRVLTFAEPGRAATSHRILRARAINDTSPNAVSTNTPSLTLKLTLDTPVLTGPFTKPSTGRVVVNGREFAGATGDANESWDGFGADNPFLAQVAPATISTSTVTRVSYLPDLVTTLLSGTWDYDNDGIPDAADNDNDGVWDGVFLDVGIPDAVDGNGNAVRLRASVLIVDLDGRFNVNAHDSMARIAYAGSNMWPTTTGTSIPMGSGYGPAEVNGAKMFSTTTSATENPALLLMSGGGTIRLTGTRGGGSRFTQSGSTTRLDFVEGRYGRDYASAAWPPTWPLTTGTTIAESAYSLPGVVRTNDEPSQTNDRRATPTQPLSVSNGPPTVWWTGSSSFNWVSGTFPLIAATHPQPRSVFNSPPDLHGRMRTTTVSAAAGAIVPQVVFGKPEWSGTSPSSLETVDDPYELSLDTRTGRGGLLHDPATSGISTPALFADNPFLPSELEPVLRPYDVDTNRLSMRLAAILGSAAEDSRLKVTTDSWDTTAVTGAAARLIYGWPGGGGWLQQATSGAIFGDSPVTGIVGGEISRGERFDLNRAIIGASTATAGYSGSANYNLQRQAYFKDLYSLLVMLSSTGGVGPTALTQAGTVTGTAAAAILAQYAANVLEFRDADSTMTPFEYDTDPSNGWDVDGDVLTDDSDSSERRVVFGAERPELLIQQAFAWRDSVTGSAGLVVTIHRPWNAKAATALPSPATIDAEPCDYALDTLVSSTNPALITGTTGVPSNLVDLGKKPHATIMQAGTNTFFNDVTNARYPIWRLRIISGTSANYVRFDTNAPASNEYAPSITSGTTKPRLAPDSTLTLFSGTTVTVTATHSVTGTVTGTAFWAVSGTLVAGMKATGTSPSATILLERLSDPSQSLTQTGTLPGVAVTGSTVWTTGTADPRLYLGTTIVPVHYIVVDSCTVPIVETSAAGLAPPTVTCSAYGRSTASATAAFWATGTTVPAGDLAASGTLALPLPLGSGNAAWFPWLNRPFVSSAELALVPRFDAIGLLANYRRPTVANQIDGGIPVPLTLLFDAVHVPSRFAGIHRSVTAAFPNTSGIFNETTPVNQLSSFREPGRVNLNTVVSDDVWNAVVAGPLAEAAVSRSAAGLDASQARCMANLLALNGSGTIAISDTNSSITVLAHDKNPLHQIYTATRLANTVTPRSNVFAIWVTLRESTAKDPDSVKYRRAFYIVDRSIPIGYEEGKDHNVRDMIRLRRIIE